MGTTSLIVLALLGQASQRDEAKDLIFHEVQENWIQEATPFRRFGSVLAQEDTELLLSLGCEHYACRKRARHEAAVSRKISHLLWGRRALDPEIRTVCEALWQSKFVCRECKGTGKVQVASKYNPEYVYDYTCPKCTGSGDVRLLKKSDETLEAIDLWQH